MTGTTFIVYLRGANNYVKHCALIFSCNSKHNLYGEVNIYLTEVELKAQEAYSWPMYHIWLDRVRVRI